MKIHQSLLYILFTATIVFTACADTTSTSGNNKSTEKMDATPQIKEENVTYTADGITYNGFVAYDGAREGKRPVVMVVHEWWGLTDYPRMRARKLAALGYLAMAVDMFGDGKTAANPQEAQTMATPFYQNPQLANTRLVAAMNKVKEYSQADMSNTVAIGYCFGGNVVLNAAKLGADLKGVVVFHGNLSGPPPNKENLKAKVLVCHGGADQFVSEKEIENFKKGMDSVGADYAFKVYPNATHAYTNPDATETGKKFNMPISYNAAADSASWNDMKTFFNSLFNK